MSARGLDMSNMGGQSFSDFMDAQNPVYGRPNWNRFQAIMDNLGNEYAQDLFVYTVDLGAIVSGAQALGQINIDRKSAFEAVMLTGGGATEAGGVFSPLNGIDLVLTDGASSRSLMQASVPTANMLGTGDFAAVLPINRRFMPATQLSVFAHVYDTANMADVQLALIGRKIWMDAIPGGASQPLPRFNTWLDSSTNRIYSEDLFYYDFALPALANNTTTPVSITFEAESDFEWILTTCSSLTTEGPAVDATNTPVSVNVIDTGDARALFSRPTPVGMIAGSGQQPFVLPQPRIFVGKSVVEVPFTNTSGSEVDNIHFTMIGRKIFEQD